MLPSACFYLAITCCLVANCFSAGITFNGFKHYRLVPVTLEAVDKIHWLENEFPPEPNPQNGLTFLTMPTDRRYNEVELLVPPAIEYKFLSTLRSTRGVQVRLIHRNYGRLIARISQQDRQNRLRMRSRRQVRDRSEQQAPTAGPTGGLTLRHNLYRGFREIRMAINQLADKCNRILPGTCQLKIIGKTYLGNDLIVLSIAKKSATKKTKIWLDGGIHAREWISHATVMYIVDELITSLTLNTTLAAGILDNHDVLILPMYNPDGYEYSRLHNRLWRKNREPTSRHDCRGVDLNRNYGFQWGGRSSATYACASSYRGARAFSAAETAAVKEFIESEKTDMLLFMSFHSYGQYILMPFAHKKNTYSEMNKEKMNCAAQMAVFNILAVNNRYYTYGTGSDLMYEANGSSDDWAHGSVGIPYSYTIELPDDGDYGFLLPAYFVPEVGRETMVGLSALLDAIRRLEAGDPVIKEDCKRLGT